MTEHDKLMEEEAKAFNEGIEKFEKENGHLLNEKMSIEEFNNLDEDIKITIAFNDMTDRQNMELTELIKNNASYEDTQKLYETHKKEKKAFYEKQYKNTSITEEDIKRIQAKKQVSRKELSIIYDDMSLSSQDTYTSRLYDPLPYHQKVEGGKITYIIKEVDQWLENQYK